MSLSYNINYSESSGGIVADGDTPPASPAPSDNKNPNVLYMIEIAGHNGTLPAKAVRCIKVVSKVCEQQHVKQQDGATAEDLPDGPSPVSELLRVIIAIL